MIYACPSWEFAADSHLLKLQGLQKSSPRHWKFSKAHMVRDLHMAFKLPYIYIYMIVQQNYAGNKQ
jgi:hypothetical protein